MPNLLFFKNPSLLLLIVEVLPGIEFIVILLRLFAVLEDWLSVLLASDTG